MSSGNPAHIIAPGEIVSDERRRRVVAKAEKPVHANLLNCICGRLKRDIGPKGLQAGYRACRAPACGFARIAEPEIVDQARFKQMSFVNQRVLCGYRGAISVSQKIRWIKNGVPVEAVVIVANREAVTLPERMIHAPDDFIIIVVLRLQEGYGPRCGLYGQTFQNIGDY